VREASTSTAKSASEFGARWKIGPREKLVIREDVAKAGFVGLSRRMRLPLPDGRAHPTFVAPDG
jgi:hypothetical protein